MKVAELSASDFAGRLARGELFLETGPFLSRIRTRIPSVREGIARLYADFPVHEQAPFADFHVSLVQPFGPRRWYRPQVIFRFDAWAPFKPLPLSQAFAMFEWGMNWCVVNHAHRYLVLHAAVVERDGCAMIMPAPPGSGKSTLCAALVASGWRLLSDELAVISLDSLQLAPLPRPVGLKNQSIDVIRQRYPDVVIGKAAHDTTKGTVAHMRPPQASISAQGETAMPAWILFPQYTPDHPLALNAYSRAQSLLKLVENAFNFTVLGKRAFDCLSQIVGRSDCYTLEYSSLDDAIAKLNALERPVSCQ